MGNLKTSFRKLSLKVDGRFLGFGTSPEADWKIIFISALLLAVLVIVLSVFIFIKIDKGEIFVVEKLVGEKKNTLDLNVLRETVSYYQNKALEFESIKNTKTPSVDPSL